MVLDLREIQGAAKSDHLSSDSGDCNRLASFCVSRVLYFESVLSPSWTTWVEDKRAFALWRILFAMFVVVSCNVLSIDLVTNGQKGAAPFKVHLPHEKSFVLNL